MNKTEDKRIRKNRRKERQKNTAVVLLCIIFFISMIYITDIATSKMLQKNDDKYAIYAKLDKGEIFRLDIAGRTFNIYIKPFIDFLKSTYYKALQFTHNQIN